LGEHDHRLKSSWPPSTLQEDLMMQRTYILSENAETRRSRGFAHGVTHHCSTIAMLAKSSIANEKSAAMARSALRSI
jgi:hypothetical protein